MFFRKHFIRKSYSGRKNLLRNVLVFAGCLCGNSDLILFDGIFISSAITVEVLKYS